MAAFSSAASNSAELPCLLFALKFSICELVDIMVRGRRCEISFACESVRVLVDLLVFCYRRTDIELRLEHRHGRGPGPPLFSPGMTKRHKGEMQGESVYVKSEIMTSLSWPLSLHISARGIENDQAGKHLHNRHQLLTFLPQVKGTYLYLIMWAICRFIVTVKRSSQ